MRESACISPLDGGTMCAAFDILPRKFLFGPDNAADNAVVDDGQCTQLGRQRAE